jgi:DNA-binding transcriptional MerR regulator
VRIGELAERTGVSVRSLRYYEEQELLSSERTSGGQRVYDDAAVDRVELIQLFFAAGLSSSDVLQLLPCVYSGTTTPAMVELLREERARTEAQLELLAQTRDRLDTLIDQAVGRLARAAS